MLSAVTNVVEADRCREKMMKRMRAACTAGAARLHDKCSDGPPTQISGRWSTAPATLNGLLNDEYIF